MDLLKKQSADQIQALNDTLTAEKETRDMWIERFEKEKSDHSLTQQDLMKTRSELKDQVLT